MLPLKQFFRSGSTVDEVLSHDGSILRRNKHDLGAGVGEGWSKLSVLKFSG